MIGTGTAKRRVKSSRRALFLLAAGIAAAACGGSDPATPTALYNEHEWTETTRSVAGVRGVVLSMPGNMRIEQGSSQELLLRGEIVLLPAIQTQVRAGILEIWLEPGFLPHAARPTEFVLTTPSLESAELADYGGIECSQLDGDRLALALAGTGDLVFENMRVSELQVTATQAVGSVRVSGEASRQMVELAAVADYEARDLASSRAELTLAGSGSATVRVRDLLVVTITGSGSVYYLGDPEVESTITGTGQVVKLGS